MAGPNPDHLFEQAEALARSRRRGAPRQVDLRRAISSAYYGLFHFTMAALASEVVGSNAPLRYAIVYRSIDHRWLKKLCEDVAKSPLPDRFRRYVPNGFGRELRVFASTVVDLQAKRHRADYDTLSHFRPAEVRVEAEAARQAVRRFRHADLEERKTFLTLLLCPIRS